MNEEKAMQKYIKNKEFSETLNDERKRKMHKMQEIEAKRILDIQMQERDEKNRLRKFEDNNDANYIQKDMHDFSQQEKKKQQEML